MKNTVHKAVIGVLVFPVGLALSILNTHLNLVAVSPPKGINTPFENLSPKEIVHMERRLFYEI